jgi:aminopeptidase N
MNHLLRGLLLVAAFASPVQAQRQRVRIAKDRVPIDTMHVYQPGIDILHYDFVVAVTPGDTLVGLATIQARRAEDVDTLRLDLLRMRVDSVLLDGVKVAVRRDSTTIRVPIAAARDSFSVVVAYRGVPTDGLIIRTDSAGRRTIFGDNWPNRARHWLPTVDHPSDKASVAWTVRAPATFTVVANGSSLDAHPESQNGGVRADTGWSVTHWETSKPIATYLMVIGVARMARTVVGAGCGVGEDGRCVVQSVYTDPELKDFAPGPFARAPAIVEFYSRLVGPYPYEKLAHLQSSTRFGGMENASAIFYSDAAFRRRALRVGLIAHETAHQWFGNSVTERTWPHLWLSEGFATYFEQLWHERDLGRDTLRANMTRIRAQILAAKEVATRPVIDTAQRDLMALLNTNSYQKGGFVLHMLRAQIGDTAFFRGVRAYYARYRHGTAVTDDLRREMEKTSGRDLRWFFDQWLRRPGFPMVATRWTYDPSTRVVAIKVEQSGPHGMFRLSLPIEIDDGETVQRIIVDIPARADTRMYLPLEVRNTPTRVTIDPDAQVLAAFTSHRGG